MNVSQRASRHAELDLAFRLGQDARRRGATIDAVSIPSGYDEGQAAAYRMGVEGVDTLVANALAAREPQNQRERETAPVACPTCLALPGMPCRRTTGGKHDPMTFIHDARAAKAAHFRAADPSFGDRELAKPGNRPIDAATADIVRKAFAAGYQAALGDRITVEAQPPAERAAALADTYANGNVA